MGATTTLNTEQRKARARLAANSRWHRDKPELLASDLMIIHQKTGRFDQMISHLERARDAGVLTVDQLNRLKRLI